MFKNSRRLLPLPGSLFSFFSQLRDRNTAANSTYFVFFTCQQNGIDLAAWATSDPLKQALKVSPVALGYLQTHGKVLVA